MTWLQELDPTGCTAKLTSGNAGQLCVLLSAESVSTADAQAELGLFALRAAGGFGPMDY